MYTYDVRVRGAGGEKDEEVARPRRELLRELLLRVPARGVHGL